LAHALASRLVAAGLTGGQETAKSELFARAFDALAPNAGDARAWWVPGRIEFLGKHTDYAGGRSLLCAADRGFAVVSVPRSTSRIHVIDALASEHVQAELSTELAAPSDHWSNYPLTVCRRLARNFPGSLRGVDLAFASDLPPAAGLSSSSALIVSTFLALADANDLAARPEYGDAIRHDEDLAAYLGAVENGSSFRGLAGDRGVGTLGGSQDHTAILCARPGGLVQYGFAPVRHERDVPWPKEHVLVVAVSGVVAAKGAGAQASYNRASATAAAALRFWREATGSSAPTLAAALAESPNALAKLKRLAEGRADLPVPLEALLGRVQQFRDELDIVVAAGDALERGDLARLGALVDMSQANAERLLGNQVPETVSLARSARELGAVAASAFGAGFGGSVYALVRESDAGQFRARWTERYVTDFPARRDDASFFITRAGPPATQLLSRMGADTTS
jgi:galactokinase